MSRPKIALIRQYYNPFAGGGRNLENLALKLLEKGFEVHIFTRGWINEINSAFNLHKIGIPQFPKTLRPYYFCRKVEDILKKEKFDIIFSLEKILVQDIYRAGNGIQKEWFKIWNSITLNLLKKASIWLRAKHYMSLYLEKRFFKKAKYKKIIANSNLLKQEISKNYNIPEEKIEVIYNEVDLKKFNPENKRFHSEIRKQFNIKKDEFLILFVGSGFVRKGLRYLIQACSFLDLNKDFKLLIVGRGNIKPYVDIVKRLNLQDKVIFAGHLRYIEKIYGASDLFVLPTLYDPFSNVCLETMASGIPVITSNKNGASEVVSQVDKRFILENPTDSFEIAKKIEMFFNHQFRERVGKLNRFVAEQYSIEVMCEKVLNIYERIKSIKNDKN